MSRAEILQKLKGLSPEKVLLFAATLQEKAERKEKDEREPCAIIGMACRLPGDIASPDALWSALVAGTNLVGELSPTRAARMRRAARGQSLAPEVMRGGFLTAIDEFDAGFFGITPREAAAMDPQQRILLEVVSEALERAALPVSDSRAERVGVFVGTMGSDYLSVVRDAGALDAFSASGNDASFLAGRLSHVLKLRGPSLTISTACSSSAVAFHLAMQSLRRRECDVAVVAGVNVIATPMTSVSLGLMGMASPDGLSRAFDAGANGYGRAEGAAVVVLQRQRDARAQGRAVLAIARGSASMHAGASASATTPSGRGHQEVIRAALADAGVAAGEVSYVEMQGTATLLGDSIEANAVGAVFRDVTHPVYIGTAKTNLGHLEGASGVAAIVKTVLALRNRAVPRLLHRTAPNPNIDWSATPFVLPAETTAWSALDGAPRVACVHSFGLSGTMAHVVLEEVPPVRDVARTPAGQPQVFVLSAKSPDALRRVAAAHAELLATLGDEELASACFTAAVGRTAHPHRLAVVAASMSEHVTALADFAEGRRREGIVVGGPGLPPEPEPGPRPGLAMDAAHAFCAGRAVAWESVFPERPPFRSLATSPWEHGRHWVEDGAPQTVPTAMERAPAAAPADGQRMRDVVRAVVATVLGVPVDSVKVDVPLIEQGLTSLGAVEASRALAARAGVAISPTIVFAYPTVQALAAFLIADANGPHGAAASEAPRAPADDAEPIAIVGAACRLPGGAHDLDSLWTLLRDGRCAVEEVPAGRFDIDSIYDADVAVAGTTNSRWGGFLPDIRALDSAYFGISPREAAWMDPQQSLLLEVVTEALDDAGATPDAVAGSRTSVYVGAFNDDHKDVLGDGSTLSDAYAATGANNSMLAGRVAYTFDLRGEAMVVDTACSSSLVAVDLAVRALRGGRSDRAIAAGVSLILSPRTSIAASKLHALSPDGRCHTFEERANGYVRSEGCAAVILKRLGDAERDGDRILGLLHATAVNQDGRSAGLTAPNMLAQVAVIDDALVRSSIDPARVVYVEAHGTGTPLGDPIEVEALQRSRLARSDVPCVLGSAKANLGHTEATAGMVGLLKALLVMRHRVAPAQPGFSRLNPRILLESSRYLVASEETPLAASGDLAAVSSFGLSGTNAHVLLSARSQASLAEEPAAAAMSLLPISARSEEALRRNAGAMAECLRSAGPRDFVDIGFTASRRRPHHSHRLAVTGASGDEMARALDTWLAEGESEHVSRAAPSAHVASPIVFVFSGNGSAWPGMGVELFDSEPVFRDAFEACASLVEQYAGWSPLTELRADERSSRLGEIDRALPMLVCVEIALAELWRSRGIEASAVVGHSVGEVAAAHWAGAISREDMVRIVVARSRLMRTTAGGGRSAVLAISPEEASEAVSHHGGRIDVACHNAPRTVVVSGEPLAIGELVTDLTGRGVWTRLLGMDIAPHSHQMAPLLDDLRRQVDFLVPGALRIPFYSTVTAAPMAASDLGSAYWPRNLREPVLFRETLDRLAADGFEVFVEIGPHPSLEGAVRETLEVETPRLGFFPSMRRGAGQASTFLAAVGALFTLGHTPAWSCLWPIGRVRSLPAYGWDRRPQAPPAQAAPATRRASLGLELGEGVRVADRAGHVYFETTVTPERPSMLADHRVRDTVIFPAAAYVELACAAARELLGTAAGIELRDVAFHRALVVPRDGVKLQLATRSTDGQTAFEVYGRSAGQAGWTRYASGRILPLTAPCGVATAGAMALRASTRPTPSAELYASMGSAGISYGPLFRRVDRIWSGEGDALGELTAGPSRPGSRNPVTLDSPILDAGFHVLASCGAARGYVPAGIASVRIHESLADARYAHAKLRHLDAAGGEGDVVYLSHDGERCLVEMEGVTCVALAEADPSDGWYHTTSWVDAPAGSCRSDAAVAAERWIVFADRRGVGERAAKTLADRGAAVRLVSPGAAYRELPGGGVALRPGELADYERLVRDESTRGIDGIVHAWSLDAEPIDADEGALRRSLSSGAASVLFVARALLTSSVVPNRGLLVVTEGAQSTRGEPCRPEQSMVWGLARTLGLEHPALDPRRIDLDAAEGSASLSMLDREVLAAVTPEREVAFRGDARLVSRLRRADLLPAAATPLSGACVISGGLGGLGLAIAKHVAAAGSRHLVLIGRRGVTDPATREEIAALERSGVRVDVVAADVSHDLRPALGDLLAGARVSMVVHAAGILDDGVIDALGADRLVHVMRSKVLGAHRLLEALDPARCDRIVFFSSAAAMLGGIGQANYAAANAYLDGLAARLRAGGADAVSIGWGRWSEVGVAAGVVSSLQAQAMDGIDTAGGLRAFDRVLSAGRAHVGVIPLRQEFLRSPDVRGRPYFADVVSMTTAPIQEAADTGDAALAREALRALEASARRAELSSMVGSEVARALKMPGSELDASRPINSFGLDSIMAVEIRGRVRRRLGLDIPVVRLLDGTSIAAIVALLVEQLARAPVAPAPELTRLATPDDGIVLDPTWENGEL